MGPIQAHSLNILRGAGLFCGQTFAVFTTAYITKIAVDALSHRFNYPQAAQWSRTAAVITSTTACALILPHLSIAAVITGLIFFFVALSRRRPSPFQTHPNALYLKPTQVTTLIATAIKKGESDKIKKFVQYLFKQFQNPEDRLVLVSCLQERIIRALVLHQKVDLIAELFASPLSIPQGDIEDIPFFEDQTDKFKVYIVNHQRTMVDILKCHPNQDANDLAAAAFVMGQESSSHFKDLNQLLEQAQISLPEVENLLS